MISSYTGFQPLKEVWMGDCYPTEWYCDFDSQAQEIFAAITELTKQDLKKFQQKLEELGVIVHRPSFDDKSKFIDLDGNLIKPPITPRDWAITLGDTLYVIPQYENSFTAFETIIDSYKKQNQKVVVLDRSKPDPMCFVPFPSVVRVGQDIFLDCGKNSPGYVYFEQIVVELSKKYRVHVTHTNEHNDGVFCPIKSNHIFSTHYRTRYEKTFPGWNVFYLNDTTKQRRSNGMNGNWWVPGKNYQVFNKSVIKHAHTWIGNSVETIFEVNMLVVDEHNIFCIAEDDRACRQLESMGITPHIVDFKCRGFWDGGLHCLTVDIHRLGVCIDYWPRRGDPGIYYYD